MLSIGEFSRVARVSTRLLRHYDQLGLLKPATVDADTGYRYYGAALLSRLNRIFVLKELGFELEAIPPLLDDEVDPESLRGLLEERRTRVAETIDREQARLRHIEARIAQLDDAGSLVDDDVIVRSEPARTLFAIRRTVRSFDEAKVILGRVMRAVTTTVSKRNLGQLAVLAHAETFEPDALDLEIGFFVGDPPPPIALDDEWIAPRRVAEVHTMAVCVRTGPPERSHVASARVARFVEARGYRIGAPTREVFVAPFDPARPESAVVEMQFPLR